MSDAAKIERNDQTREPSGEAEHPLGSAPLEWFFLACVSTL
jgi:hypothetical protein